jgi:hypothetical protein
VDPVPDLLFLTKTGRGNTALSLIYPLHSSLGHVPFSSLYSSVLVLSTELSVILGTSLYSLGTDHIGNTLLLGTRVREKEKKEKISGDVVTDTTFGGGGGD